MKKQRKLKLGVNPPEKKTSPVHKQVITFEEDHRFSNPGLHWLHLRWAYANLQMVHQFLENMEAVSQVSMHLMASALGKAMQEEIKRSAAYFEAAALLFAGIPCPVGDDELKKENKETE